MAASFGGGILGGGIFSSGSMFRRARVGMGMGLGALLMSCAPSQYDFPIAVGVFVGTFQSDASTDAGTITLEVSRATRVDDVSITLTATETRPAILLAFPGPIEVGEFEARSFTSTVTSEGITWELTGNFSVTTGREADAEATLSSGELIDTSSGDRLVFAAAFDPDGGSGDPLE